MSFFADLHVHSRFSRATSRECTLVRIAESAAGKGLCLVGTGDFTHPGWLQEIKETLVPDRTGLFRLRPDLQRALDRELPPSCRLPAARSGVTRFMLTVEISGIYRRDGRVRKVHNLVCVPDMPTAERLIRRLSRIGNLESDGRPILGLDSRDLLEIVLESSADSFLIPAHIWTPWFSVLGSQSGFDSIPECYGDLSSHVFALETGLSSDPPMNWRLSQLDGYRLVSNSDAHSPSKLGREACVFDCSMSFRAVRKALETGTDYGGTIEFFPEEGKYHLDGHRNCGICLTPRETRRRKGLCKACGKPVTVGVLNRVEQLADRPEGAKSPNPRPFRNSIPLSEILAEIMKVSPSARKVQTALNGMVAELGPELHILDRVSTDEITRAGSPLLAEAISRMRSGRVIRTAGYDGKYGAMRLFTPDELKGKAG